MRTAPTPATGLTVAITAVALGCLTACAASPAAASPAVVAPPLASPHTAATITTLAHLATDDERRDCLRGDLTPDELQRVGFDQVTIDECIDRVVCAAREDRSGAGSPEARSRLVLALEHYFAAAREAAVRRSAGAAPCLPLVRPR